MTVRDTIIKAAEKSDLTFIYEKEKLPVKFYELTQKEYAGKRTIDIILSLLGLIPLVLLMPFLVLGIKLSSRGPIFFKQKRTGRKGQIFTCYKVRTMHVFYDSPSHEKPAITQKGDIRVFKFGLFLRRANLDELPQLFNILKGDMSLVGPRPYMESESTYWNSTFDDYYYRYAVRPGLTGLAQVQGLRGGNLDKAHMRERLDQDLIYVEKQTMWLDIKIILKTALQMLHLNTNAH